MRYLGTLQKQPSSLDIASSTICELTVNSCTGVAAATLVHVIAVSFLALASSTIANRSDGLHCDLVLFRVAAAVFHSASRAHVCVYTDSGCIVGGRIWNRFLLDSLWHSVGRWFVCGRVCVLRHVGCASGVACGSIPARSGAVNRFFFNSSRNCKLQFSYYITSIVLMVFNFTLFCLCTCFLDVISNSCFKLYVYVL